MVNQMTTERYNKPLNTNDCDMCDYYADTNGECTINHNEKQCTRPNCKEVALYHVTWKNSASSFIGGDLTDKVCKKHSNKNTQILISKLGDN